MKIDYLNGHCADFAVVLFELLASTRPDVSLVALRGKRGRESVLIHAYVGLGEGYLDAHMKLYTEDDLETRLWEWLEYERWYGKSNAEAWVEEYATVRSFKQSLRRCYRFDNEIQAAAKRELLTALESYPDLVERTVT